MIQVKEFFDRNTSTYSYVVYNSEKNDAAIIDPVLSYNNVKNTTSTDSFLPITDFIGAKKLEPKLILETHIHADHLSASQRLKEKYPNIQIGINENVTIVQKTFSETENLGEDFICDGSQFDILLKHEQIISTGSIKIKVLFTPGHTPTCTSFVIEENVFTGDALFMPDLGCGRCDFPGGNAEQLFESVLNQIYTLPDNYQLYVGHDYPPTGRALKYRTTIKDQKENNKAINLQTQKMDFVKFRTERDRTLNEPKLLKPSMRVNLNGGSTNLL